MSKVSEEMMSAFLKWASQAEEGKGFALGKDGRLAANAACRKGYGDLLSSAGLHIFIINDKGREVARLKTRV